MIERRPGAVEQGQTEDVEPARAPIAEQHAAGVEPLEFAGSFLVNLQLQELVVLCH